MKLFDLILFFVMIYFLYNYFYDNIVDSDTDSSKKTDTESSKKTDTVSSTKTDTESSKKVDTDSSTKTDTDSSDEMYNENKSKYTNATLNNRFRYKSRDILTNDSIKDEKFVKLKNEINELLNSDPENKDNIYKQKNFYKHVPFESYEELYNLYEKNIVLFFRSNFNI